MTSLEKIGEEIDKLICTIDMTNRFPERNVFLKLYENAKKVLKTDRPLTLTAAEKLEKVVKSRDAVLITTGVYLPPYYYYGETDGPPGAAVLARALNIAFDATPIIIAETQLANMISATCTAAGMNVVNLKEVKRAITP